MPIYEYTCPKCDHITEALELRASLMRQSIPCNKCGTMSPKKPSTGTDFGINGACFRNGYTITKEGGVVSEE